MFSGLKKRFPRAWKIFYRVRIVGWLLVFVILFSAAWMSLVGLPGFLKTPLLEKLRARGFELQFKNLRLSWYRGFVAYEVKFDRAGDAAAPQFSAGRVEVPLNSFALRRLDFEISGLRFFSGKLVWPASGTNTAQRELTAANIEATVHFLPNDVWQLDNLQGRFAGVKFFVNGSLAHASAFRDWKFSAPETGVTNAPDFKARLFEFVETLDRLKFSQPPGVRLGIYGDARDWRKFKLAASAMAADAGTPWGAFTNARVTVHSSGFAGSDTNAAGLVFVRVASGLSGGQFEIGATVNAATRNFRATIHSALDPSCARPLLDAEGLHALSLFACVTPPVIDAKVVGNLRELKDADVSAQVALDNFSFRGQSFTSLRTRAEYTNLVLRLIAPVITRGKQRATLDGVGLDFNEQMVYFTNCESTLDPMPVVRAIGRLATEAVEPYEFAAPPHVFVNGSISMETSKIAALAFTVDGGPMHWWKLNLPHVTGELGWTNRTLVVTNIAADFYAGKLNGWAAFDFSPTGDNDNNYEFDFLFDNVRLELLMTDLATASSKLSGLASGWLAINRANTPSFTTWQGSGTVRLRDGELWGLPIFGALAPVLDAVYPNLGNGRASDASATVIITNGVVRSDDLELRSAAMRMQYRGTVDFDGNVNARVLGELMRDTWVVGPIVSTVFWPLTKALEYKISGTLNQPKLDPLYIPKAFLIPFHPFSSFKQLFTEKPGATNAPPKFLDVPPQ